MRIKEPIKVDDTENSLILKPGDIDGFHICENEGDGCVYVYYTESKSLRTALEKVESLWKKT